MRRQARFSPFVLAVVLSPAVFAPSGVVSCRSGDASLAQLAVNVDDEDQIVFSATERSYDVWLSPGADTALVRAVPKDPLAQVWIYVYTDADPFYVMTAIAGGGEATVPLEPGTNALRVYVKGPGGASNVYAVQIQMGSAFPCTEQGIRDAIAEGGGVHEFDCDGPTTVPTGAELAIEHDVALDGEGNLTIDGAGGHRVVWIGEGASVDLRGLSVTNGRHSYGAGILSFGTLRLSDSTVSDNITTFNGGGIYNIGGTVTVERCIVAGNRAGGHGGGICNFNDITDRSNGMLTVIDSSIVNNHSGSLGGGIYAIEGTTTTVMNCSVRGNIAAGAGGINAGGTVSVANSLVAENLAEDGGGGGIRIAGGSTVLEMANSTVSGNASTWVAGGLMVQYESIVMSVNSTIAGNTGAAIDSWLGTNIILKNTLIEGSCHGFGTSSDGGNIGSPGDICVLDDATDQVNVSAEDLKLEPLADNGGATETHALVPGSVAVDAIPGAMCEVGADQRGVPRPQGAACDVGAFELEPSSPN